MATLVIAYCVISFILIVVLLATELIPTYKVGLWTKEIILIVLLLGLAAVMLYIPTNVQKAEAVGDAVLVERFADADLYYDAASDFYFAVETDRWDIFNLYTRVEIPQELAKEKANVLEVGTLPKRDD